MTRINAFITTCLLTAFIASGCESKNPPVSSSQPASVASSTAAVDRSISTMQPTAKEPIRSVAAPIPPPPATAVAEVKRSVSTKPIEPSTSVEAQILELPSAALSTWRNFAGQQPTLVLLSNHPFLQPIPDPLAPAALALAKSGSPEELRRRGTALTADPLLLPGMTLTAALRSGFFAKVVWVIPSQTDVEKLDIALFRQQLVETGAATPAEAGAFVADQKAFSGRIQGIPFLAVHHTMLPRLQGPVLLHIDLSYFQALYRGEIKTPLYPLLAETYTNLSGKLQPLSVTISLSNLEGGVPLASRFVGKDFAAFFRNPLLPNQPMPQAWAQRANAIYLENFFQNEKIRDIYQQMRDASPADPSVRYGLHTIYRQLNQGDQALHSLGEAVRLDPVYALEYLLLADLAQEKQLPEQRLRMLEAARLALPENPFIPLQMIDVLLQLEHYPVAATLVKDLSALSWSPIYYPQMPELLRELAAEAAEKTPAPAERR